MKSHRSPMGPPPPPHALPDSGPLVYAARKAYQKPTLVKAAVLPAISATTTTPTSGVVG